MMTFSREEAGLLSNGDIDGYDTPQYRMARELRGRIERDMGQVRGVLAIRGAGAIDASDRSMLRRQLDEMEGWMKTLNLAMRAARAKGTEADQIFAGLRRESGQALLDAFGGSR